jgi:hypothetical protein
LIARRAAIRVHFRPVSYFWQLADAAPAFPAFAGRVIRSADRIGLHRPQTTTDINAATPPIVRKRTKQVLREPAAWSYRIWLAFNGEAVPIAIRTPLDVLAIGTVFVPPHPCPLQSSCSKPEKAFSRRKFGNHQNVDGCCNWDTISNFAFAASNCALQSDRIIRCSARIISNLPYCLWPQSIGIS